MGIPVVCCCAPEACSVVMSHGLYDCFLAHSCSCGLWKLSRAQQGLEYPHSALVLTTAPGHGPGGWSALASRSAGLDWIENQQCGFTSWVGDSSIGAREAVGRVSTYVAQLPSAPGPTPPGLPHTHGPVWPGSSESAALQAFPVFLLLSTFFV